MGWLTCACRSSERSSIAEVEGTRECQETFLCQRGYHETGTTAYVLVGILKPITDTRRRRTKTKRTDRRMMTRRRTRRRQERQKEKEAEKKCQSAKGRRKENVFSLTSVYRSCTRPSPASHQQVPHDTSADSYRQIQTGTGRGTVMHRRIHLRLETQSSLPVCA